MEGEDTTFVWGTLRVVIHVDSSIHRTNEGAAAVAFAAAAQINCAIADIKPPTGVKLEVKS